jgi:hypothetical protein
MNPDPIMQSELLGYLGQLGCDDQAKVVHFARTLAKAPHQGTPGKELSRIIGTIPHDDLEQMKQVIEEECERIEANDW